jgi:hypothetical protein
MTYRMCPTSNTASLWKQNAEHTGITDPEIIATKNMHAKSQRIAVNVSKNKHDVKKNY